MIKIAHTFSFFTVCSTFRAHSSNSVGLLRTSRTTSLAVSHVRHMTSYDQWNSGGRGLNGKSGDLVCPKCGNPFKRAPSILCNHYIIYICDIYLLFHSTNQVYGM